MADEPSGAAPTAPGPRTGSWPVVSSIGSRIRLPITGSIPRPTGYPSEYAGDDPKGTGDGQDGGGGGRFRFTLPSGGSGGLDGRRRLIIGGVAGAVFVFAYVGAAWAASDRVPRGTTVSGVALSGLSRDAAEDKLLRSIREASDGGVPVKVGERTTSLDVKSAGLTVDVPATVDPLVGFSLSPAALWRQIGGGGERDAVLSSDAAKLDAELKTLAEQVAVPAQDAAIVIEGTDAKVRAGSDGSGLDVAKAAEQVRDTWLSGAKPLVLPVTKTEPKITTAEAEGAVKDLVDPALAAPLAVKVGSKTVSLPVDDFAPSLSVAADGKGNLSLRVDGAKLRDVVLEAAPDIGVVAKDATIALRGGRPAVVPGVEGVTIDPKSLAESVRKALTAGDDEERTASVTTTVQEPELTTAEAEKLGVKEQVSTFSTNLTSDSKRTENLRVAARTVNGTLVLPGETFSLNAVLGERTPEKGYNEAPAINNGRLVRDYGGGVSQMATTIFNNVFFAGLEDIYHKPHSFYISRYPEGREATVNWPTVDLKWRNDSPYGVLIQAWVTDTVNVSFWSTKVWDVEAQKSGRSNARTPKTVYDDSDGCVAQEPQSGFDVAVKRIFKQGGRVVKTETFNTRYIAEDKVVCGPKPGTKPGQPGQPGQPGNQ